MFKGLHSTLNKVKTSEVVTKHPDAVIVQPASILLGTDKRQEYLSKIKILLNLPPKLYDNLYYKVVEEFAEFCQTLPETQHGVFAHQGGFLDHGLERASRALTLCLNYFFPKEKSFQGATSQQALWLYAVFTAALFFDVGKIAVKYEITLCNKDGSTVKEWLPYSGTMNAAHGKFYRFSFTKQNRDNLKRLITASLARQILDTASNEDSTSGFNWIASDPDVLETWLTLLQGETRLPMSSFMSVIPIADAQIIENYFANLNLITQPNELDPAHEHDHQNSYSLFDNPHAPKEDYLKTIDLGEAFIQWLREQIANNQISVNQNDSPIHIVDEGALLNPDLFEKFAREAPNIRQVINPEGVEKQFRQALELYWDSPGNLQHRYSGIQGISATNLHRYLLVSRLDILFVAGYQALNNPNVLKTLTQKAPTQTLPAAIPAASLEKSPTPENNNLLTY